ncbi:MAG: hypothetical protein RLO12_06020, partial [Fulvivirga sp.]
LSSSLKIKYSITKNIAFNEVQEIKSKSQIIKNDISVSTGTALKGLFNFGSAIELSHSVNKTIGVSNSFTYTNLRQKVIYRKNKFKSNLTSNIFNFSANNSGFSKPTIIVDIDFNYKLKSGRVVLGLVFNNILNKVNLDINSIDAVAFSNFSYGIIPRYLMLTASIRL